MKNKNQGLAPIQSGFTLIELLIVIAMIGILASVLIAVINPLEMLARSRDAARRSSVEVLIKGASSYNIANNNQFPTSAMFTGTDWINYLKTNNYLDAVPAEISPATGCTASLVKNDFCYVVSSTSSQAVIYVGLESQLEKNKCPSALPFYLWSSADGRAGTICSTTTPLDPTNGGTVFSFTNYQ